MKGPSGRALLLVVALGGLASAAAGAGSQAAETGVSVDRCQPSDYSLALVPGRHATKSGLVLDAGLIKLDVPVCTTEATFRLTIRTRAGAVVRSIRGNPVVLRASGSLTPWSPFARAWRWTNWCGVRHPFRITGTAAGQQVRVRVDRPPPCVHRHARSRLSLTTRPRSGNGRPARMLPADVPPPFSPSAIRTTNGWQVSNGRTLVDVYAGEAGNDASIGMFGILRQDLEFGWQTRRLVAVGSTGAIRITQAPLGAGVETSAQRADVEFSSPSGAHGVLHLADDTAELLP